MFQCHKHPWDPEVVNLEAHAFREGARKNRKRTLDTNSINV